MSTISKANRPRKSPGMTHNNKPRYRAYSIKQLEELLAKASTPKIKNKIRIELERKKAAV